MEGSLTGHTSSGCHDLCKRYSSYSTSLLRQCRQTELDNMGFRDPRIASHQLDWPQLRGSGYRGILPTLQSTNNGIALSLAGKPKRGTTPLPVDGSFIAVTTKGKSFRKRQRWLKGDDELAAYDRKGEVWISSRHNIQKHLFDDVAAELQL